MYGALTGPPWGLAPDQIARLTDWQIKHLYLDPENRRREAERAAAEGRPAPAPRAGRPDPFAAGLPPRAEFVALMRASDGGTAAHWHAVYDALLAEQERTRATPV